MNTNFEIGKVIVPVPGQEENMLVEGVKIQVEGLDLKDYVMLLKEVPGLIREIRAALEEDMDAPSAIPGMGFNPFAEALKQKLAQGPKPSPFAGLTEDEEEDSVLDSIFKGAGLGGFDVKQLNPNLPPLEDLIKAGAKGIKIGVPKNSPFGMILGGLADEINKKNGGQDAPFNPFKM